jgi:hypothetical protein
MKRAPIAMLLVVLTTRAWAWGPLGHRVVAETAALLVADDLPDTWGPLVARHRFDLGVYAFLPDARFRHIDGAGGKLEAPTHYRNLDAAAGSSLPVGTVDRRVEQFLDLARDELKGVHAPKGGYQRGSDAKGDARHVYLGLYDLGVMAHYSGDASQPYHAISDFNGTALGQGGIHFYFESACVDAFEPGLAIDVLAAARKYRARWLAGWGVPADRPAELVMAVLADSLAAAATVSKLDKAHAVTRLQAPGSSHDAERKPPAAGCGPMRSVLVERLAKGAVLTAALWETALPPGVTFRDAAGLEFSDMELDAAYVPPR